MPRRFFAFLLTAMLACFGLALPTTAHAHSDLISSTPSADSTVNSVLGISLTFADEIIPDYTTIVLTGPDGTSEALSTPSFADNNTIASVEIVQDALPNGVFTVGYSVVSIDSHPISGSYTFTLAQPDIATVTEEPAASPTTTSLIEPREANDGIMLISAQETQMPLWAVVLIVLGGLVVVAVVVVIIVAAVRRKK